MAAFSYRALNAAGKTVKGVCEAESASQARTNLRAQSLTPLEVSSVSKSKSKRSRGSRVKSAELCVMTRQLSTLVAAGIPLDEALQGVAEQQSKSHLRAVILGVRAKVLEGHSLATGLAEFPKSFPHLFRVTVASGEESGQLAMILNNLADYTEHQQKMRSTLKQAMIYPAVMLFVCMGVIIFLLSNVVPHIVSVFQQGGQALPLATTILLSISSFVTQNGLWLLLGIVVYIILWRRWKRADKNRARWHKLCLRLPLIGGIIQTLNAARFARTLGILTRASVPLLDAMNSSAELITVLPMRYAVQNSIDRVREGNSLYKSLEKTGYFSPIFVHLLASGEASGELDQLLQRVADQQDREVETVLKTVLTLFEPLLILFMGAVVLFIVLAILLPIFNLDQMVG